MDTTGWTKPNPAGCLSTLSEPATDHTRTTALPTHYNLSKMLANLQNQPDGSGTGARATSGDPEKAPERINSCLHTSNTFTRSVLKLKDVPPREEPFLKAPTPKDQHGQTFTTPKELSPLLAPKRKLLIRRLPLVHTPSRICEIARSPTPILLPLLLRMGLSCRNWQQEKHARQGDASAPRRFSSCSRRLLSRTTSVPTLVASTTDTTSQYCDSTTLLLLLHLRPTTTTVLATMLLRSASSTHLQNPAGLGKPHTHDPNQSVSFLPLRLICTKVRSNVSGTTSENTLRTQTGLNDFPTHPPDPLITMKTDRTLPQRPLLPSAAAHNNSTKENAQPFG